MTAAGKRIMVAALGTRGDVQPALALCLGLRAAGHAVTVVAGSNFAAWVARHDLRCVPSVDMEAVMSSARGLAWTENSQDPMRQLRMMRELVAEHADAMFRSMWDGAEGADLLISGFTSEPFVQAISEKRGVPYLNAHLQPTLATCSGAAALLPLAPRGESVLNRWMGRLSDRLLWSVAAAPCNRLRAGLGLPAHSASSYAQARRSVPVLYGFSPHVVPPARDWPAHAAVTGYWFLDEDAGWQPPPSLAAFLEAGPPPVYIGFGSMPNSAPERTLALIVEALRRAGVRAIIGAGWGALDTARLAGADLPPEAHLAGAVPHAWLFPRVAAVVHHGGAGTTAAGLRAGRPTMVIPHMSDQPYWGRRVHELGVGARPVPRHQLTAGRLAAGLRQLTGDEALRGRAGALGEKLRAERGVERAVEVIAGFG